MLIRAGDGSILGSVGISGDVLEQDEARAVYGVKSAGLVADTGDPAQSVRAYRAFSVIQRTA